MYQSYRGLVWVVHLVLCLCFPSLISSVVLMKGDKKTLVMREIPETEVKNLLSNKESLAACDIAVFVHDRITHKHPCLCCSSDEESWKRTKELLVQVASHGENTGFEVPCLIISAKDDLDPYPLAVQDSTRVFCG
ncbi:hypothetical protein GW17_00023529 [Ensete ventricosum]|nr:hypothetical protein GW17_00023529 [Ensete ventricosum]RZR77304.1 hypothetical protein BHM03_00002342 [Ensete ventricosum]